MAAPFPAEFELSSLLPANGGNGSTGFVLNGIDGGGNFDMNDRSDCPVSAAGDVNGDGIDDLLIGAPGADPDGRGQAGESYVVLGQPTDGAVVMCEGIEATIVGTEGNDTVVGTAGPT